MKAQRIITRNGKIETIFDEKCVCGNTEDTINEDNQEYATCLMCLRVYRYMERDLPDGRKVQCWGIYFDPYLRDTLVGQFMLAVGIDLPENRYPSAKL